MEEETFVETQHVSSLKARFGDIACRMLFVKGSVFILFVSIDCLNRVPNVLTVASRHCIERSTRIIR